jgi:hypothetical protein
MRTNQGGVKMKTKLSPFVYKVKGKKNVLLLDSLKGLIFTICPEGCPHELEAQLLENGLVTGTRGVIPFKFKPNVDAYKSSMVLRELQLRIGGQCQSDCPTCGEAGRCKKDDSGMSFRMVDNIAGQLTNVEIDYISITGGNPLLQMNTLKYIKKRSMLPITGSWCILPSWEDWTKKKKAWSGWGLPPLILFVTSVMMMP